METLAIPALADNVIHVVFGDTSAVVVDPGGTEGVLAGLSAGGLKLEAVLLTHCHGDHTGGAAALRDATGCAVVGPDECAGVGLDLVVAGGGTVTAGTMRFRVVAAPGHTAGHVCYHMESAGMLWTGDTLFVAGCGRILDATADMMWRTLCVLRALPPETMVFVGHDYTLDNLDFALEVLPGDASLLRMRNRAHDAHRRGEPAAASTIALEREGNIFLRSDSEPVAIALGMRGASPIDVFAELRRRKDAW